MKKLILFLIVVVFTFTLVSCKKKEEPKVPSKDPWIDEAEPMGTNHMLKDLNGNFGGSYDEKVYGKGAPLNGKLDIENSIYFDAPDYFYLRSTEDRTIYSKFRPYQQTMQDTDGISCLLMALNYYKEDIKNKYTEIELVKKYEKLNNEKIYNNGTTLDGLINVITEIGYETEVIDFYPEAQTSLNLFSLYYIIDYALNNNDLVFVKVTTGTGFRWKVIIGLDSMGTPDYYKDDVVIFGDPLDIIDHKQDGYFIMSLSRLYSWWLEFLPSGEIINERLGFIMKSKEKYDIERVTEKLEENTNVPKNYLIKNKDGSYGGSRDEAKYGGIIEKDGMYDHLNTIYYTMPDFYNMKSTDTRILLNHYRTFQQTMGSTCGICSTVSVLDYYKVPVDYDTELVLNNEYEKLYNTHIKGNGVSTNGLAGLMKQRGYNSSSNEYKKAEYIDENSRVFKTYEEFITFLIPLLESNTPLPVSWRPVGGHWTVIIGFDDMGTENIYDDILIFADSHDIKDHYQDGYNTYPGMTFFNNWFNKRGTKNQGYYYFLNK